MPYNLCLYIDYISQYVLIFHSCDFLLIIVILYLTVALCIQNISEYYFLF